MWHRFTNRKVLHGGLSSEQIRLVGKTEEYHFNNELILRSHAIYFLNSEKFKEDEA